MRLSEKIICNSKDSKSPRNLSIFYIFFENISLIYKLPLKSESFLRDL